VKRIATALWVLAFLLVGCEQFDRQETGWIKRQGPYASSLVEYIRGAEGVDIGASLTADFTGTGISFKSLAADGQVIEFEAETLGVNRSDQLEAMAANIEAMNGRLDAYAALTEQLLKAAIKAGLPGVPDG